MITILKEPPKDDMCICFEEPSVIETSHSHSSCARHSPFTCGECGNRLGFTFIDDYGSPFFNDSELIIGYDGSSKT